MSNHFISLVVIASVSQVGWAALLVRSRSVALRQVPRDSFTADADALASFPDEPGMMPSCHPKCWWTCDDPVCEKKCEPLCSAPLCQVRCPEMDVSSCKETCDEPSCLVVCPQNRCEMAHCPECKTLCGSPKCKVDCGAVKGCTTVCGEPVCEWKCKDPEDCPKPKCEMQCEKELACTKDQKHIKGIPDPPPGMMVMPKKKEAELKG